MESSSAMVPFPLLMTPIESNYRACTIPYRFDSDNPRKPTPTEILWIDLFSNSVPSFRERAESDTTVDDAPIKAEKFAARYTAMLEDLKRDPQSHGGPPDCILLCRLREQVLRELGFKDIFKKVKDDENAKAISLFKGVVQLNDAIEDGGKRLENLIRGILAGNIFDLGSAQLAEVFAKDGMSFLASCQSLVSRPWVIDDLDLFKLKWSRKSWKKFYYDPKNNHRFRSKKEVEYFLQMGTIRRNTPKSKTAGSATNRSDKENDHWWFDCQDQPVGYWPGSLFRSMATIANLIQWGGQVWNTKPGGCHTNTQMGSNHFPKEHYGKAAFFDECLYESAFNKTEAPTIFPIKATSPSCYDIAELRLDYKKQGVNFPWGCWLLRKIINHQELFQVPTSS